MYNILIFMKEVYYLDKNFCMPESALVLIFVELGIRTNKPLNTIYSI